MDRKSAMEKANMRIEMQKEAGFTLEDQLSKLK